jgi:hypothetical protein
MKNFMGGVLERERNGAGTKLYYLRRRASVNTEKLENEKVARVTVAARRPGGAESLTAAFRARRPLS